MEQSRLIELLEKAGASESEINEASAIHSQGKYEPEIVEGRRPSFFCPSDKNVIVLEKSPMKKTFVVRYINDFDIDIWLAALPEITRHLFGSSTPEPVKDQHPIEVAAGIFEAALKDTFLGRVSKFRDMVYGLVCDFYTYSVPEIKFDQVLDIDYFYCLPMKEKKNLFYTAIEVNKQDFLDLWAHAPGMITGPIHTLIGMSMKPMNVLSSPQDTTSSGGGVETFGLETSLSQSVKASIPQSRKSKN